MKKRWFTILICAFAGYANAQTAACDKPLVISFTGDWEPYIYALPNGRMSGTDFDLLSNTLQTLSCDLNVLRMNAKRVLRELSKGSFDVTLGATYTEQRAANYFFSQPYRNEQISYAMRASNPYKALTLAELLQSGSKVAINLDGFFGDTVSALKTKFPNNFIHSFSLPDRLQLLIDGKVDAVVDDRASLCQARRAGQFGALFVSEAILHETQVHFIFTQQSVSSDWMKLFDQALVSKLQTLPFSSMADCDD